MHKRIGAALLLVLVFLVVVVSIVRYSRGKTVHGEVKATSSKRAVLTHKLDGNHWIVSRLERDDYLNDLSGATKQITLKPNPGKEPDSVVDLAILKIAEESPMYAAGFRKDDQVMKVNGTPIRTMSRAVNLVHEIKATNRLTVQVQRGDKIIDYQFDFE